MKGIVLAGGKGTRLLPLTKVINKHLLPVYDRPMVFFPIQTLVDCGIKEILLISNPQQMGDFFSILGHGDEFDAEISYAVQDRPYGIAHALSFAQSFVAGEQMALILGDNIFFEPPRAGIKKFVHQKKGGRVYLKKVNDPQHFGIAKFDHQKRLISLLEKPLHPPSTFAVVGLYLYNPDVFAVIEKINPSHRGELEITDVNNFLAREGNLSYENLKGQWIDAGSSLESLYKASTYVKKYLKRSKK